MKFACAQVQEKSAVLDDDIERGSISLVAQLVKLVNGVKTPYHVREVDLLIIYLGWGDTSKRLPGGSCLGTSVLVIGSIDLFQRGYVAGDDSPIDEPGSPSLCIYPSPGSSYTPTGLQGFFNEHPLVIFR